MKKYYWRVRMYNGGYKIMYLTEKEAYKKWEYTDYICCGIKIKCKPELLG